MASEKPLPDPVRDKLKSLPAKPGCYLFKDGAGEVLYAGKALSLKNRVRSYFQASARHGLRIARMVSKVRDLEWIVVDSEVEALVLECNLIKRHRPPFNVRLRDDKSYPYIVITDERFPRVVFSRNPRRIRGKAFGPYTSAFGVRDTLQLLHKTFPLIPCGKSWSGRAEQRPCLYYHLGQCLAPCAGLSDPAEYAGVIDKVERFLQGKEEGLVVQLRQEMADASEALEFERAARLRDQIGAIEQLLQRQKVLQDETLDQDVIAVVKDERGAAVQMLYIRGGKLIGQRQFMLDGSGDVAPGEAVGEFVKQYYAEAPEIPREILLPLEIEERKVVQSWLRTRRGQAVSIEVPQRGEKLRLVEMAASNAEQALEGFHAELQQKERWAAEAMSQLQETLGLPAPPLRIEGYDISNTQGTAPVGSMVVAENGEPAKAEYRRFRIRFHPESPNDFAMMHEVLLRRLRAFLDEDPKFVRLPDLIVVDGGMGQLGAALKARDQLGLSLPMVGLAKKLELIYVPHPLGVAEMLEPQADLALPQSVRYDAPAPVQYRFEEIALPMTAPGLMLLRKLRDEAHRFALSYHRKVRDKRFAGSALDEVPGIGPKRRRLLLRTFGSLEGIRRASVDEIAAVPTLTRTLAQSVKETLQEP